MAKMKNKAAQFLDKKTESKVEEPESNIELHQCSFCQEELKQETFLEHPYGKFVFVQTSKLLYYSMTQTLQSMSNAFANESYKFSASKQEEE
jgi:hypothetical protein